MPGIISLPDSLSRGNSHRFRTSSVTFMASSPVSGVSTNSGGWKNPVKVLDIMFVPELVLLLLEPPSAGKSLDLGLFASSSKKLGGSFAKYSLILFDMSFAKR